MPPLARAAGRAGVRAAVGHHARADAGAEQRDDGVAGAAARAEPQFGLAEGLRAVGDVEGEVGGAAQQRFEGDRVPADALAVHHGAAAYEAGAAIAVGVGADGGPSPSPVLDDSGHADAHAEDRPRVGRHLAEDRGEPVEDQVDD